MKVTILQFFKLKATIYFNNLGIHGVSKKLSFTSYYGPLCRCCKYTYPQILTIDTRGNLFSLKKAGISKARTN